MEEILSLASQTKPSSPRSETMLKWNSSKVPTCSSVGQQQLANQERWTGYLLGRFLHCASTCFCQQEYAFVFKPPLIFGSRFLASQSLQTLMCEKDRRVMLALCIQLGFPSQSLQKLVRAKGRGLVCICSSISSYLSFTHFVSIHE